MRTALPRKSVLTLFLLGAFLLINQASFAQVLFQESSATAGLDSHLFNTEHAHGLGVIWIDYNNDNWPDILVTNGENRSVHLYRNEQDGTFSNQDALLPAMSSEEKTGAVFADYDNDGDLDVYITVNNSLGNPDGEPNILLQNQWVENGGVASTPLFIDVASTAGVDNLASPAFGSNPGYQSLTAAWFDYDRDSCIDLFVGNMVFFAGAQPENNNALYRNNCDGTFANVTVSSGINPETDVDWYRPTLTAFAGIMDPNDIWPDLYVTNVQESSPWHHDFQFRNNGDGTFTEMVSSMPGIGDDSGAGMGIDIADIDLDGDWDIYMSDLLDPGNEPVAEGNPFYTGNPDGTWNENSAPAAGITGGGSWGIKFADFDQDGFEDLMVGTGDPILYHNDGDGTFTNITPSTGIPSFSGSSRGLATADYDRDGDLDVLVVHDGDSETDGPLHLYENITSNSNNYLQVHLVATQSNRAAINTLVKTTTSGVVRMRQVKGAVSAHSQDELVLEFGLGTATNVDQVEVLWPSGEVSTLMNVGVNQMLTVTEPDGTSTTDLFTDVSTEAGVAMTHDGALFPVVGDPRKGTGAAWFDYDMDGDLDLYTTLRTQANKLWSNNGDGTFTDMAAAAGVENATGDGSGVVVADYNNDGCKDLFLANGNEDVLYQNNCDGTFSDVTVAAGLDVTLQHRASSASWGDYNNDGFVDLYIANHTAVSGATVDGVMGQDYIFHNDGDGTFTDVSDMLMGVNREGRSFVGGFTDFDKDGDLDIFKVNDCPTSNTDPTEFFRNDGGTDGVTDWTFTEISSSIGADWCQQGMGLAMGDYDRDLDTDLFFTDNGNTSPTSANVRAGSVFLRNDGGSYSDQSDFNGTANTQLSWGANFFDYDLDGWLDLYMAAGGMLDDQTFMASILWENNGDGTFGDVSTVSGGLDTGERTRTSAFGDYDGDGDPDMFIVNYEGAMQLFRNNNNNGHNWVIIDLEGVTSNRDGIGAKIEVTTPDGVTQYHEVRSGSSLGAGDDIGGYFGLAMNSSISSVQVTWPSGTVQTETGIGINQRVLITETSTPPPPTDLFTDVSTEAGVAMTHDGALFPVVTDPRKGTGAAWFDYDMDGDLDLYTTLRTQANKLWSNNGDGTFTDMAAAAGVENATGDGSGVVVADYNNDGCKDLFLANGNEDVLYQNNCDGTFSDVTVAAGLDVTLQHRASSASWGDYNNDGFVDLYIANHTAVSGATVDGVMGQDYIFHNDGDGTFTDVSDMLMGVNREGRSFVGGFTDFDKDGDLDIFKVNDCPTSNTDPTEFFRNDGGTDGVTDWTFTEISSSIGADWCQQGMGLAMGDYDRDLDTDLFFTDNGNTSPTSANVRAGSVFLRNDGGSYSDQSDFNGTANTQLSWGANFFDYDLDGWLDLYMAAGGMLDDQTFMASILWENNGDGTFGDVSTVSGGLDTGERTRTSAFGDYDGDGDPDMFIVNYEGAMQLFRNNNNNGHNWVIIDLEGVTSNRDGIGAKIEVTTPDGVTQYHEVRSGSSLGAGDDIGGYFGLAMNSSISSVQVTWPSGTVQTETGIGINQRVLITENATGGSSTLTASPASVDFGQVGVGSTSAPVAVTLTNNGTADIDVSNVSLTGTDAAEFGHDFPGNMMIPAGGEATVNVTFSPTSISAPILAGEVLYRVNAGGALVADWEEDSETTPSQYVNSGDVTIVTTTDAVTLDATVPVGTPAEIFQSHRIDAVRAEPSIEWDFPVTAGQELVVRLFFAEIVRCQTGGRVFDVVIEGTEVLTDYEVLAEVGCEVGTMKEFIVTPADGNLDVNMNLGSTSRPSMISAIEVATTDGSTGGGPKTAQMVIDHNGTNGSQTVDLSGEGVDSGGNIAPSAAFTSEAALLDVTFTDGSTDADGTIVSWSWDFGDGNTSTDQNPVHAYAASGTYSVSLTVTDDGGLTDVASEDVTVSSGDPVAAFTHVATDLAVVFTDASTDNGTIASWSWDFGDGTTSTDPSPSHTYATAGTYSVSLTVTDNDGLTDTATADVTVSEAGGTGAFIESEGMVVMEAENFHTYIQRGSHDWVESTEHADFSGAGAMKADPDNNTTIRKKDATTLSPEMVFDVDFTTTGSYIVWVRVFAPNVQGSTVHLGSNGSVSASKMNQATTGSWEWTNVDTKSSISTVNISTAGVNTVHVWMRQDGLLIDKILLTQDGGFVPTGQGPAESPRAAGPDVAAARNTNEGPAKVLGEEIQVPTEFALNGNYPNPFNPTTTISFDLPEASDVTLEVFDMMGRRVATLVNGQLSAGAYEAQWNARSDAGSAVASGVYLYRLQAGSFVATQRMVLMK